MSRLLKIGITASFLHKDPQRPLFKNKTLLYLEQSLAHWVQSEGAVCLLVPTRAADAPWSLKDLVAELDGLVLQGGADLSPETYGETALQPEWAGDAIRDAYEIELLKECFAQDKPILGVCRGAQLINVAFGGSLYQDINTQVEGSIVHRDWDVYDQNFHAVRFEVGSRMAQLYPKLTGGNVCSIHHQAVKKLGKDLAVDARSEEDGVIEAVRHVGPAHVVGVQWHPEFHCPTNGSLMNGKPLLKEFLSEAQRRKTRS